MRLFLNLLCLCFLQGAVCFDSPAQDAADIVRRADKHAKGSTSFSDMTVEIVRPTWTRDMTLKTWTKGNDFVVILVTDPAKDRGIVYLKRKKEVWNWIPSIERSVKLPPSIMSQSWMGTDFTNDDLVKEASIVEDYTHRITGEEVVGGRNCYRIVLTPKAEAAVIWGSVVLWIDKQDLIMMKAEYYDEEQMLVNTLIASDIRMLGGRMLPARMEMIPADKKGHKTVLIYHSLSFDKPIDDNFFSTQNMQRVK
jgi:hypothetical protein